MQPTTTSATYQAAVAWATLSFKLKLKGHTHQDVSSTTRILKSKGIHFIWIVNNPCSTKHFVLNHIQNPAQLLPATPSPRLGRLHDGSSRSAPKPSRSYDLEAYSLQTKPLCLSERPHGGKITGFGFDLQRPKKKRHRATMAKTHAADQASVIKSFVGPVHMSSKKNYKVFDHVNLF